MTVCSICDGVGLVRVVDGTGKWVSRACECQEMEREERRLTAAMVGNGHAGSDAVEEWLKPRQAEVERIRTAIHEIAGSGLTLSKLSVAASLLGDLAKQ